MGSMRLTGPMKAVLTETLDHPRRTPEGETLYQVDALGVWRTVGALQRRGLVVMEARTVLDGLDRAYQAFTSWLTAEGVEVARRLAGVEEPQGAPVVEASQERRGAPGSAEGTRGPQEAREGVSVAQGGEEAQEDGRAVVLARLDAVWSVGYVTSPPMSWEDRRIAAEVVADHYTAGGSRLLHGRMDRGAVVEEYRARDSYDLMNAYGSVRMSTGGDVWALVGRNRGGERWEALAPMVERVADAHGWLYWESTETGQRGVESPGVVSPGVVVPYLAQELSVGSVVHRHARGALRVTRESGAVVVLRPVGERLV